VKVHVLIFDKFASSLLLGSGFALGPLSCFNLKLFLALDPNEVLIRSTNT